MKITVTKCQEKETLNFRQDREAKYDMKQQKIA